METLQSKKVISRERVSWRHPFVLSPHKTLLKLSLPVLFSLVAEPLTGLVDTAFIARLGTAPLAALGVGTMALSSLFWVFNFIGIGTQTEVAQALGTGQIDKVRRMTALALVFALAFGLLTALLVWPLAPALAAVMGAAGDVHLHTVDYIRVRVLGAPAVLISIAAFGVCRGRQDMRTPLWIAAGINGLNMVLDPLLIFGPGPFPSLGVAGAAGASVISYWAGAIMLVYLLKRDVGLAGGLKLSEAGKLLMIGRDLFIRTGMLTLFLLLATRAATQLGPAAGAAHQAIRQVWLLTALFLDAFAITGQSLVAFFIGVGQRDQTLKVARVVCLWSLATGAVLTLALWLSQPLVIALLVPGAAEGPFTGAWRLALLAQPINALAFATDGLHWGSGDFAFLRNVVVAATLCGAGLLFSLQSFGGWRLSWIWAITAFWILIRAGAGVLRIWPGGAASPIRKPAGAC